MTNAREYLLGYLQWLDPDRVGLPEVVRRRLMRALSRYGVTDLHRNPALESAVVRLFTAQSRLPQLAPVVSGILERRLRYRDRILPLMDRSARNRYDRITAATQGHLESVADLSRDNQLPVRRRARGGGRPRPDPGPDGAAPRRARRRPAARRPPAAHRRARGLSAAAARSRSCAAGWPVPDRDLQATLLEVRARRWYRIRELRDLRIVEVGATVLCCADYDYEGRAIHLVLAFAPVDHIPEVGAAIASHLATVDPAARQSSTS